jgi:uncharacterized protein (DUF58 family)
MTKETFVFFGLLVAIALAGFNSGNNLLYLISGVMIGSILISLIAGRVNLSRLAIRRRIPPYIFAGHPFRANLEVLNNKRLLVSYGVSLEGGGAHGASLFFVSIGTKDKKTREIELLFNQRGIHRFPSMTLSCKFPLGLFELRKKVVDEQEIIVYPCIHEVDKLVEGSSQMQDELSSHLKGPGSGVYSVREYYHGESATNISWKLSAKLDKLTVKETEREEKRRVCVVLDNAVRDDSPASLSALERAVSAAASLVWYLSKNEYSLKLVTRNKTIGYGIGSAHTHRMLIALALAEAIKSANGSFPSGRGLFEGGTGVLVTCGDARSANGPRNGGFALVISERIQGEGE